MTVSKAAQHFQESAIRRIGALSGSVPGLISFAAGYPAPDVFPWNDLQSITTQILARRDGSTLQYGATRGYRPLIEHLLAHTLSARGISSRFDDIVITSGSQQGLDLIGRVLIDPGDPVIVELPTYSGAIAAFHNLQASLVGVPQDADGIEIASVDRVATDLKRQGKPAKFIYVTPNFQNPAGLLMSAERRRELLDAARRHDLVILEDDPYGSIYFEDVTTFEDTRPIKADDTDNRVIYLGSFSKILVPGLRVAWMVAPPAIAQKVELCKQAADISSGVFDQRIVHGALAGGVIDRIAPGLRAHYQAKRTVMERALESHLQGQVKWTSPRGGFFLWIELPPGVDDRALFDRAIKEKVSFVLGSAFFVNGAGHEFARLAFSGISHEQIEQGIGRLAAAINTSTD
ncbi:MAG TPA: PLP-dependent aminotransferase family protein [Vicinamibacterales bacterium]|nr:PLP-dependent aminotransferase family protein [Vicinamibacterales bacterium]